MSRHPMALVHRVLAALPLALLLLASTVVTVLADGTGGSYPH